MKKTLLVTALTAALLSGPVFAGGGERGPKGDTGAQGIQGNASE